MGQVPVRLEVTFDRAEGQTKIAFDHRFYQSISLVPPEVNLLIRDCVTLTKC